MSRPSIKKNYIYSTLYQGLTMFIPFITTPYISRVLGSDGVGVNSFASSIMMYFTMFASLGTASYGMREIAISRNDKAEYSKKFWEIELLSIVTTTISLIIWIALIICSSDYRVYFAALIPSLFAAMFDISWFYTGHEKIGYTVFLNSVFKILGVVLIFVFIKKKQDLFVYMVLNSFILMLGNISMWIFLPKLLIKVNPKEFEFKLHLRETFVYFIPTIATSIYTVLDKTLIGVITKDSFQNGYYEQATKIINMAKTAVFVSVNNVMGARMSYLFSENRIGEIKQRINKSLSFILLLGYGAMFGIIAVAEDFVPLFFGEGYEPVITLLYFMSPLIVIIGFSNCLGSQYYTPAGLRKISAKYIIIGSVTNMIMNLIFIPIFSTIGAVIGTIAAELTISVLYVAKCNGYMTLDIIWENSYKRLMSGLLMLMSIVAFKNFFVGNSFLALTLEMLLGITVYFASLFVMKDRVIDELMKRVRGRIEKNG